MCLVSNIDTTIYFCKRISSSADISRLDLYFSLSSYRCPGDGQAAAHKGIAYFNILFAVLFYRKCENNT